MSKSNWGKTLLGLAAVGGAVAAGALYLSKKNKCEDCEDPDFELEDEDFDLDSDLKPVDRGYVSLTPSAEEAIEETEPTAETEEVVEEEKEPAAETEEVVEEEKEE